MTEPLCLRIHPLTLGPRSDTDGLAARWGARFWSLHQDPVRLLAQVHSVSFDAVITQERQAAGRLAQPWADGVPVGWRYPWHLDTAYLLDRLQAEAPPLQVAHYCLVWPSTTTARETLPATLAQTFLLPGAAVARLPNLIPGAYREQARYLEPLQPGYPYLAILVAYASLGSWDLASWWDLLLADVPLTVALDVQTLRRDTARTKVLNAANRLWTALHGTQQVIDPDADDAYHSAKEAHRLLREQNLHLVTTAILISGREPAELDRADQIVQERLAANLRLERPTGGQRELAKLFTPLPFERVRYPAVSWNTLSAGMGAKQLLWGIRRQTGQRGIIWGMSLTTGLPEIRDLWTEDHPNLSALLCGKPGSGKTTAQLTLLKRMAVQGCRVIYVDPLGKGRLLAEACAPGSAYYDVHADGIINPLDVVAADFDQQAAAVRRKLALILGLTDMDVDANRLEQRRFTLLEEAAIDLALQQLYGADLAAWRHGDRPQPTLPDLVAHVTAVVAQEQIAEATALARDLQYFVRMHRAERFMGQTTVAWDFRPDVVAYSFAHVPKDLRPLYYTIVFEAIDDYVRSRPQWPPLIACIDELRYMAQVAGLMDFVRHATRTWRNKGAGLWAADQNPGTWFGDGMAGAGQMTANNTRLKWFGQLDPDDIRIVMERFGDVLTADDQVALRMAGRGDAVCIFDTEPLRLHLGLTDRETEYFVRRARDDQNGHVDDAE